MYSRITFSLGIQSNYNLFSTCNLSIRVLFLVLPVSPLVSYIPLKLNWVHWNSLSMDYIKVCSYNVADSFVDLAAISADNMVLGPPLRLTETPCSGVSQCFIDKFLKESDCCKEPMVIEVSCSIPRNLICMLL